MAEFFLAHRKGSRLKYRQKGSMDSFDCHEGIFGGNPPESFVVESANLAPVVDKTTEKQAEKERKAKEREDKKNAREADKAAKKAAKEAEKTAIAEAKKKAAEEARAKIEAAQRDAKAAAEAAKTAGTQPSA